MQGLFGGDDGASLQVPYLERLKSFTPRRKMLVRMRLHRIQARMERLWDVIEMLGATDGKERWTAALWDQFRRLETVERAILKRMRPRRRQGVLE